MIEIPPVGDQVPRRDDPFLRWLGIRILSQLGWRICGELPNVPKLVAIGAPHTSNWDGVIGMSVVQALQVRINTMGKDSLFRNPLFARFLRWLGLFPIDRSSPHGVVGQSIERLKAADKLWLLMAPEGTRHGAIEWKTGFYNIAVGAGVPILTAGINYVRREVVLMELFYPSGNLEEDLPRLLARYADMAPKRPERLSLPLKELQSRED